MISKVEGLQFEVGGYSEMVMWKENVVKWSEYKLQCYQERVKKNKVE